MTLELCPLTDIPDGEGKGFELSPEKAKSLTGGAEEIFVVRQGNEVFGYANACPHLSTPLDWVEDQFMSRDKKNILCATHGAIFRILDGLCIAGPCEGEKLRSLNISVASGNILLSPPGG